MDLAAVLASFNSYMYRLDLIAFVLERYNVNITLHPSVSTFSFHIYLTFINFIVYC